MSYRSARKKSSYLVRAKLYPLEREVSSKKYGKSRCDVYFNIHKTETFMSIIGSERFKINDKLNCDDNCCGKQYVGETTDEF